MNPVLKMFKVLLKSLLILYSVCNIFLVILVTKKCQGLENIFSGASLIINFHFLVTSYTH